MFCPYCGKPVSDQAKFCGSCGSKLPERKSAPTVPVNQPAPVQPEDTAPAFAETPEENTPAVSCVSEAALEAAPAPAEEAPAESAPEAPVPVEKAPAESTPEAPVPVEKAPAEPAPEAPVPSSPKKEKAKKEKPGKKPKSKKRHTGLIITLVLLLVLAAGCTALYFTGVLTDLVDAIADGNIVGFLTGAKDEFHPSDYVIVLSDKAVKWQSTKGERTPKSLSSSRTYDLVPGIAAASGNGEYVYYITDLDETNTIGDLYRIARTSISSDPKLNEKRATLIAEDVYTGITPLENGAVLFTAERQSPNSLCYFDGETCSVLADSIDWYHTDGNGVIVYATKSSSVLGSSALSLYKIDLARSQASTLLASDIAELLFSEGMGPYVYMNFDQDGFFRLFSVDLDGNTTQFGDKVYYFDQQGDRIYFLCPSSNRLNPYDYVSDPFAEEDARVEAPKEEDFMVPAYTYTKLDSTADLANYPEIYTSCTVPNNFYTAWGGYKSMVEASSLSSHKSDIKSFIAAYKSLEDDDGFFPVNDEIRSGLEHLATVSGSGYEGEWLELCFSREESGTKLDEKAYKEALDAYADIRQRNELRDGLQRISDELPLTSLYVWENGQATLLADSILDWSTNYTGILFSGTKQVTGKIHIGDMLHPDDLVSFLYTNCTYPESFFLFSSQRLLTLDSGLYDAGMTFYETVPLFESGGKMFFMQDNNALIQADFDGSQLSSFQQITAYFTPVYCEGDTFFYYSSFLKSGNITSSELHVIKGGNEDIIATIRDISNPSQVALYEDGTVLCLAWNNDTQQRDLILFADGQRTRLAEDCESFARQNDGSVLFLSDDTLYLFDGEVSNAICEDADGFLCLDEMSCTYLCGY